MILQVRRPVKISRQLRDVPSPSKGGLVHSCRMLGSQGTSAFFGHSARRVSGAVPKAPGNFRAFCMNTREHRCLSRSATEMPVQRSASRPRIKHVYSNRYLPPAGHAVQPPYIAARRARLTGLRRVHAWRTSAERHSYIRVPFEDGWCSCLARAAMRPSRRHNALGTASKVAKPTEMS